MSELGEIVFLIDCDNTLLDDDRILEEFRTHLEREIGPDCPDGYWAILEQLRAELGYADYLGALQLYRQEHLRDMRLLAMSSFLVDYPFADRLFPTALDVVRYLASLGRTVILSDGDAVLQPRKIEHSGLRDAVDGRVLIYIHKEQMLEAVEEKYPARHYVMLDDKIRVLAMMKALWRDRLTTVFVRQGRYAADAGLLAAYPAADVAIDRIGDVIAISQSMFSTS